jgi:mRNA export factor
LPSARAATRRRDIKCAQRPPFYASRPPPVASSPHHPSLLPCTAHRRSASTSTSTFTSTTCTTSTTAPANMALFGSSAPAAASTTTGDTSKDVEVQQSQLPSDSIQDLQFSPTNDFLAVGSWDKKVYIYEVNGSGANGKWFFECPGHVLGLGWSKDGTRVAAGDSTGMLNIVDFRSAPASGQCQAQQAKAHDEAIKCVRWFQMAGQDYVATGSWDKKVKFWNLQGAEPVGTLQCQERVYSMDIKDQLLVIATAERHIHMVNLNDPTKIYKTIQSPLKWQTRVVSCFSDASGFAVGSIEGRCAIQYVEDKDVR